MTYSVDKKDGDLDIQALVEQLKRFLKPNQDLAIMLVTEDGDHVDFDVSTTFEKSSELQSAMGCYAEMLGGDDDGVDEETEDDPCLLHDPVPARRALQ